MTPATQEELFAVFGRLGIAQETVEHPAIYTAEEGRRFHGQIPGLACKNLFLKDKKGQIWLVCMPAEKRAHLAQLERAIGSARLSFAKPELLMEVLAITPGSVTPFALMNDRDHRTRVVLDSAMLQAGLVNFHPLRNTASTALQAEDLLRFIKELGFDPCCADCGDWAEEA